MVTAKDTDLEPGVAALRAEFGSDRVGFADLVCDRRPPGAITPPISERRSFANGARALAAVTGRRRRGKSIMVTA
ncbi:hypothetical protein K8Z49_01330 [Actinomadura madurae]|uniref:hypothetical protein n=1 Tax=Actinomadura madurae TaxID=1993 RepID=UPI00399B3B6F